VQIELREQDKGDDGRGNAARRQPADDAPIDGLRNAVDEGAGGFRRRRIKQVRADRGRRADAENQDQKGRHQRPAADARQTDQKTDGEPGYRIERVDRVEKLHGTCSCWERPKGSPRSTLTECGKECNYKYFTVYYWLPIGGSGWVRVEHRTVLVQRI
jgi:hypothetical protein